MLVLGSEMNRNAPRPNLDGVELLPVEGGQAAALGVHPGFAVANSQSFLQKWHERAPWCSPICLAGGVEIFDFTERYDPNRPLTEKFRIGRYDEDRCGMYETELFKSGPEPRTIHMGIDIGAGEGTPVFAPLESKVWGCDFLESAGDYGGVVIVETPYGDSRNLYMLFGHLSKASVRLRCRGDLILKGELVGWLGARDENGGWNPHLHWQLSWLEPLKVDLPGAVTKAHREFARKIFPDPTPSLRRAFGGWS